MDLEAPDNDMLPTPASSSGPDQQPGVSSITRPRSRRGGPGTAPQGSGPAYRLIPPHQSDGANPRVHFLLLVMAGAGLQLLPKGSVTLRYVLQFCKRLREHCVCKRTGPSLSCAYCCFILRLVAA